MTRPGSRRPLNAQPEDRGTPRAHGRTSASRIVIWMPTRRLTGTSVNTGPDARLDAPFHDVSRSDRCSYPVACRVALWRTAEARRRPNPCRPGRDTSPAAIDCPEGG